MADTTKVKILDKDYLISCSDDESTALVESACYLDKKMREVRGSRKIHGLERIAVMVALNITHELLQKDDSNNNSQNVALRLATKIEETLQSLSK